MKAVIVLTNAALIVETRTITRNLFENALLAIALSEDPQSTFDDLVGDFKASRKKRGKTIIATRERFSDDQITVVLEKLKSFDGGQFLAPATLANKFRREELGLFYAQLSADSAHPSFDALDRHLVTNPDGELNVLAWDPTADPDEMRDTVGWACNALLLVLFAIQKLTRFEDCGGRLPALLEDFNKLLQTLPD